MFIVTAKSLQKGQSLCFHLVTSLSKLHDAWPINTMTGAHTALIIRPYDISSVAYTEGMEVRGVAPTPHTEAPYVPQKTNGATMGRVDFLEKQCLPTTSKNLSLILSGFHIWSCYMSFGDSVSLGTDEINHKDHPPKIYVPMGKRLVYNLFPKFERLHSTQQVYMSLQ